MWASCRAADNIVVVGAPTVDSRTSAAGAAIRIATTALLDLLVRSLLRGGNAILQLRARSAAVPGGLVIVVGAITIPTTVSAA